MAQVPYQPAPSVTPERRPTPSVSINTPVAAFGGAVAGALEGLGKGMESAGNELFARANAMQELQEENKARQADADAMQEMGMRHVQFSTLEGKDAVEGFQPYMDDLRSIYQKHRDGLTSDYARRLYDSSAMSNMQRSIFSGAGHAATQQKEWSVGTANSQKDMINNRTYADPKDEVGFQRGQAQKRAIIRDTIGPIKGWDETQTQDAIEKSDREGLAHRITGMANEDPFKAEELLEKNRDKLGVLFDKTEEKVRGQLRSVGSRMLSTEIMDEVKKREAEGKPIDTEQAMIARIEDKAKKLAPNDPVAAEYAKRVFEADFAAHQRAKHNDAQDVVEGQDKIMREFLPKNVDAFRATPNGEAIYSRMTEKQKLELPLRLYGYQQAILKQTDEAVMYRLRGMADEEPMKFLGLDPTKLELSQKSMNEVMKMQAGKRKDMEADPHVQRAYQFIRSSLPTDFDSQENADKRHELKGALQEAIVAETAARGKPPNRDELDKIGKNILKQFVTDPGSKYTNWIPFFGGETKTPFYQLQVSKEAAAAISKDWNDSGRGEPTDEQIHNEFIRAQYIKLFSQKSSKDQSLVPISK